MSVEFESDLPDCHSYVILNLQKFQALLPFCLGEIDA